MAKCKWCERKGIFLAVDNNGLCRNCLSLIPEIGSRIRVLTESVELARTGKTLSTRLSRTDVARDHAEHLVQYERAGIPTLEPRPSELLVMLRKHRRELVEAEVAALARKAQEKASLAATPRAKERALAAAVLKIKELTEAAGSSDGVETPHLQALHCDIHRAKLDGFLEAAQKAEFKGNAKKAVDQYQEALFFLHNDGIDDEGQSQEISRIEAKIQELQTA